MTEINNQDDCRSISSSSFRTTTMSNQTFFSTPSFVETGRLDASVSDWIDQNQPHFPHQSSRPTSRSAVPLLRSSYAGNSYFDSPTFKTESLQTRPSEFSRGIRSIIPAERSTFAPSSYYPESITPSSYPSISSVLRQRHVNHAVDNDDASSVYTVASSMAPSLAPSIVPSEASTGIYQNAEENVQDVEMMELDESLTLPGKVRNVGVGVHLYPFPVSCRLV